MNEDEILVKFKYNPHPSSGSEASWPV